MGICAVVVIVGLLIGLALFYFWLRGNWFARWLVAIVLIVPGCWLFMAMIGAIPNQQPPLDYAMTWAFGFGFAWLVASLPTFFWRAERRARANNATYWTPPQIRIEPKMLGRVQQRVL